MKLKTLFRIAITTVLTAGCLCTIGGCNNSDSLINPEVKHDTEHEIGYQLEMPKDGEEIAIIHTSMGDITWRFFPENAPKAVENFKTLAKDGKYDNVIFHRVMNDFMIQGGDYEEQNGTGGTSAFGKPFEDEFCDTLYNIRGSVAMANSGVDTNGSQFFINQAKAESFNRDYYEMTYEEAYAEYEQIYSQYSTNYGSQFTSMYKDVDALMDTQITTVFWEIPDAVFDLYEKNGGNLHLDGALRKSGGHTVFAQVIDGMDVVDAIAAVEVSTEDATKDKPLKDVLILSVEFTTYKAQ